MPVRDHPVKSRDLIAVFDESGGESNVPGEASAADFALAAVILRGSRSFADLVALDTYLRQTTGREDYKYRHVRQLTNARKAIIDALDHQSGLIRIFGYYAAGGAFVQQAKQEVKVAEFYKTQPHEVIRAHKNLEQMITSPRVEGLKDAINTSIPAMSAWAQAQRERITVYFDERTDLATIASDLESSIALVNASQLYDDTYQWMDWGGACPEALHPIARIADVFAGDIRATFKRHGPAVWQVLDSTGFVGKHEEVASRPDSIWSGPIPVPRVGLVPHTTWDVDWATGSTETTMFGGYRQHMLKRTVSAFSPCGRGCLLAASHPDGFEVFQVMD